MKVFIGKHPQFIGPYQIADALLWKEEAIDAFATWMAGSKQDSWFNKLCVWINDKRKRTVFVKIDRQDVWSADSTLAHVIAPLLKRLKADKNGSPRVDDEDVPDHLKSTAAPPATDYDIDANWHLRWEWVLDEMIWAFEQHALGEDHVQFFDNSAVDKEAPLEDQLKQIGYNKEAHLAWVKRKQHAFVMFGKYYQSMWS